MVVVHLFEPLSVATTPLMFLALGAGAPGLVWAKRTVAPTLAGAVAGGVLAGLFLYGAFALQQADLDFKPGWARTADTFLPVWGEPEEMRARVVVLQRLDAGRRDRLADALPLRRPPRTPTRRTRSRSSPSRSSSSSSTAPTRRFPTLYGSWN